ncbi:creatininase family protein [Deinococcus sp.]|uniref:creatininase family protein n=1 Tax=Deinococcus sp. TaxID=47478 RepID=UPI003C7A68E3
MSVITSRRWADLSWQAIRDLPKEPGVVVLPIGAIEQHGPHLPVWTDALLAERLSARAFELLAPDTQALLLPTLSYGKSNEHTGYPGTIALSAATLMALLRDIAVAVSRSGFTRLLFINTHGGNKALLEMMCRDLRAELGLLCFLASGSADTSMLPALEKRFGIHANTAETSMLLHLTPELVGPLPAAHYPDFSSPTFNLTTQPQVGWLTRDWSPDGHFGDPSAATPEAGATWFGEMAASLAAQIAEASSFSVAHG